MSTATRPVLLRYLRLPSDGIRIEFADAAGFYDAAEYEAIDVAEYSACDHGKPALTYRSREPGCVTILRCTDGIDAPSELHEIIGELLCMPRSSWSTEALAVVEVKTPLVDSLLASLGGPVGEPEFRCECGAPDGECGMWCPARGVEHDSNANLGLGQGVQL